MANNIDIIVRDLMKKGYNVIYREPFSEGLNITIIGYNSIIDDVFYMNRMVKDFPSIYYTINRKIIDDIKSKIYIDEKLESNNNESGISFIKHWVDSLPTIDVKSLIRNIIEKDDIDL